MKKFAALFLTGIMAFSLAACGGSSKKNDTDSSSSASASKEKTGAVKLIDIDITDEQYAFGVDPDQKDLLEDLNSYVAEIKKDGTFDEICDHYFGDGKPVAVKSAAEDTSKDQLVVATNAEFEPFEYMQGNDYVGIDMEIAQAYAKKAGKELVIKNMDFDSVCLSVSQHKADVAMAGLTVTPDRKKQVSFTDPYYEASQKLIVKGDDTTFDQCKSKEDVEKILTGLKKADTIGGQQGTTAEQYVEGSEDMGFKGLAATWKGYTSASMAVQDMMNNNIKYVMADAAPAKAIVDKINAVN